MTPEAAFEQFSQAVYAFGYRLTGRQDLAEDLTQETFLALVRAPKRFDPSRGNMKTFLFAIARNLAWKHFRDHRAEQLESDDTAPLSIDPRIGLDVGSAVAKAMAALPPLQLEAVVLFEYEGVTLEELAKIVGADVGTVKSRPAPGACPAKTGPGSI